MLAVAVGLLLTLATAVGIMVVVALPHLRNGSRILTPDGERVVERARKQAKRRPAAAAGSTWHGLVSLGGRLAAAARQLGRLWAPVGAALHDAMDRLEGRDGSARPGRTAADSAPAAGRAPQGRPEGADERPSPVGDGGRSGELGPPAPGWAPAPAPARPPRAVGPVRERFDVDAITRWPSIARPRPVPPISGPIPEIHQPVADRTIDLRSGEQPEPATGTDRSVPAAESPTGSIRHAR